MKVTNSAHAKFFKDSWVQIRDVFRVLDSFATTHLKEKCEDEFAGLEGQLDVETLVAQCTICTAKVAEFCGARACARPLRPLETRATVIDGSKSAISALRFSEPLSVALGRLDGAADGVNSGVVRGSM